MNLRFPIVAAVVAIAAGAAGLRALQPRSPAAALGIPSRSPPAELPFQARAPTPSAPARTIVVYVAGEVARAGVYSLPASARGADALRAAGGAAPNADLVAVNLAARLADGEEMAVPARGAISRAARGRARGAVATLPGPKATRKRKRRASRARSTPANETAADASGGDALPTELIDLNAADADALETLPGIGPALAERIVAVRDQSGPFASTDDLLDVSGMTQGKLDAIAPYVTLR